MDNDNTNDNAIAIVGMSGRFPGAADVEPSGRTCW